MAIRSYATSLLLQSRRWMADLVSWSSYQLRLLLRIAANVLKYCLRSSVFDRENLSLDDMFHAFSFTTRGYIRRGRRNEALNLHGRWISCLSSISLSTDDNEYFDVTLQELGLIGLHSSSEWNTAERCIQDSISMMHRVFGQQEDNHVLASAVHSLGCCFHQKGALEDARAQFNKSLRIKKKLKGQVVSDLDIALILQALGKVSESEESCSNVIRFYQESFSLKKNFLMEGMIRV